MLWIQTSGGFETALHLFPQSPNTCASTNATPSPHQQFSSQCKIHANDICGHICYGQNKRVHSAGLGAFAVFTNLCASESKQTLRFHLSMAVAWKDTGLWALAWDHCTSFMRGKCLCKASYWNLATTQRAKNATRTIPPTLFLMVVHRGNNHKKPGSLSEW